jgi:hypothetical protein
MFWLPELYRRRALLHVEVNQSAADALSDIDRALALAEEQGAAVLIARVRADIERLGLFRAAAHP